MIKYVITGTLAGVLTSMGLGGGSIMIPILYMFSIGQKEAQLINVIYYIPIALIATVINSKNQLVNYKISRKIIVFGIIGAIIGAYLSKIITGDILKKIFGVFMIILGAYQFKSSSRK